MANHKNPLIRIGATIWHEGQNKRITGIFDGWIELEFEQDGEVMLTHTSEYKVARSVYRSEGSKNRRNK